jgi:hypothetical protein
MRHRTSTLHRAVPDRGGMHTQQLRPRRALAHGASQLERPPMAVRAAWGLTPALSDLKTRNSPLNVPLTCGAPTPDLRERFPGACGRRRLFPLIIGFAKSCHLGIG